MQMFSKETAAVVCAGDVTGKDAVLSLAAELELAGITGQEREMLLAERVMEEVRLGFLQPNQARRMLRGLLEGSVLHAFRVGADRGEYSELLKTEVLEMLDLAASDPKLRGEAANLRTAWQARTA
jgi:hypothetical protein